MRSTIHALCLLLGSVALSSAATVTYSFNADVPTNDGPRLGSFSLTVTNFISPAFSPQFTGSDFNSCSAPGTGMCVAQFSLGPSPLGGVADDIGFGNNVCCFIYFFPEHSFEAAGTYMADAFHSAGQATLTVSVSEVPEPSTLGFAMLGMSIAGLSLRRRRSGFGQAGNEAALR